MTFLPGNVWRTGLVLLAVIAFGLVLRFLLEDGGTVIFTVLMSWFAAIAMAPVVDPLSRHMKRGFATILVMLGFLVFVVVFVLAFGSLLVDQLSQLVSRVPDIITAALDFVNTTFHQEFTLEGILDAVGAGNLDFGSIASSIGANVFGIIATVLGSVFGIFTFALFTFYLSAQGPQLQVWVTRLFPARQQGVVANIWRITAEKTGGYVGARIVLGTINARHQRDRLLRDRSALLAAAGDLDRRGRAVRPDHRHLHRDRPAGARRSASDRPVTGIIALVWALLYQQVENLTIEPRISAKAVDVNPAVSFGAVLLGAALFGVAGAFLAVPVVAMMLALLDIYGKRYELATDGDLDDVPEVVEVVDEDTASA